MKLPSNPTIGRLGKLQRLLRALKRKDFVIKEQYENMYPSSSQPARLKIKV